MLPYIKHCLGSEHFTPHASPWLIEGTLSPYFRNEQEVQSSWASGQASSQATGWELFLRLSSDPEAHHAIPQRLSTIPLLEIIMNH